MAELRAIWAAPAISLSRKHSKAAEHSVAFSAKKGHPMKPYLASALLLCLLLAGCGGDKKVSAPDSTSSSAKTTTLTAAASAEPTHSAAEPHDDSAPTSSSSAEGTRTETAPSAGKDDSLIVFGAGDTPKPTAGSSKTAEKQTASNTPDSTAVLETKPVAKTTTAVTAPPDNNKTTTVSVNEFPDDGLNWSPLTSVD